MMPREPPIDEGDCYHQKSKRHRSEEDLQPWAKPRVMHEIALPDGRESGAIGDHIPDEYSSFL